MIFIFKIIYFLRETKGFHYLFSINFIISMTRNEDSGATERVHRWTVRTHGECIDYRFPMHDALGIATDFKNKISLSLQSGGPLD